MIPKLTTRTGAKAHQLNSQRNVNSIIIPVDYKATHGEIQFKHTTTHTLSRHLRRQAE